ncbi:hypothetical protein G6011_01881 [Alternaria panax]|uniref:Heterokaryon incompatibility domain-containing protein n=1 Tax=Alternaria panax TaxID=48097 RepID=A0AAD4FDM3_9PLEO|nr:hypothetical protein G6011_01881 [Alternaria panax]
MVAHMFKTTRHDRQRPEATIYMFPRVAHLATKYRRMILHPRTDAPDLLFIMPTKHSSDMFLQIEIERYAMVNAAGVHPKTIARNSLTHESAVNWLRIGEWVERCLADRLDRGIGETMDVPHAAPRNFRLLDVNRSCLTEAPPQAVYAALSYVWGQKLADELECTMDNVATLSQPGQLSKTHLPETIRDALTFCAKFNIPYLWVDRLCIIQDDSAQKHDQISAMDAIYSLAILTICAAAGDSSRAGLPGIGHCRKLGRLNAQVFDAEINPILPEMQDSANESTWPERGWTFQESLLGGCLFVFTEYQVFFNNLNDPEVGEMTEDDLTDSGENTGWFEDATSIKEMEVARDMSLFEYFRGYLNKYSRRKLSYASDTYNAFAGAYKFLYEDLDTYIYGLPAKDFDAAITWFGSPPADVSPPTFPENAVLSTWSWGSMVHWAVEIRCGGDDMIASVAKWARCNAKGDFQSIQATNDPTAHQIAYRWIPKTGAQNQSVDPRPYILAAWSTCIEAPIPKIHQLRCSSVNTLGKRWPTYAHYWKEALRNHRHLQADDTLQALRAKPGRIAIRTTVQRLRVWPGATINVSQDFFIIDDDGWCMGVCRIPVAIAKQNHVSCSLGSDLQSFDFLALSLRFSRDTDGQNNLNRRFTKTWLRDNAGSGHGRPPPLSKEVPPSLVVDGINGCPLEEYPFLTLMMVGWNGVIAHRIDLAWVSLARWIRTAPGHRTVVLE